MKWFANAVEFKNYFEALQRAEIPWAIFLAGLREPIITYPIASK
jgi:hypothetical protein